MQLPHYLGMIESSERNLAEAFLEVGQFHMSEPDVLNTCVLLAKQCEQHAEKIKPVVARYGDKAEEEPDRLHSDLFKGTRKGSLGLLRDLHDLYLMACESDIIWTLLGEAAQGLRDSELFEIVNSAAHETATQKKWLKTRMKQAAPQTLLVASS